MKFIARHLNHIGLVLLASFAVAAAGLYHDVPQKIGKPPSPATPTEVGAKGGCCAAKAKAEPLEPSPAFCPYMAAQTNSGCGSGCSH